LRATADLPGCPGKATICPERGGVAVQGKKLGSYTLISELGSGGMGTVYLAEVAEAAAGLEPGQKVAVKFVHSHLLSSPGFFKRFLREAELGSKVVHENVVRTFDVDATVLEGKAVHYMVMEYVEGKSLRQLLTDLGTIPETLLREIALQIAAGLGAIHEAGIVHRDLKPENVLITDEHRIRIMDLGVAKLQEASISITKEGQFAGSVLYAAPEQFGPEDVGPSVDLYSLGVMLYELATGDNPFRRDDAAAVIEAHLKLQPPRITDLNTETTSFLSELVATLLAKKPARRFESAQVLHDVLAEAERSHWWTELEPKLRKKVAHLPKIRVRRDTELHGRDEDLGKLDAAWQEARNGEGNTVFIEGEAGIGKTRLIDAFLRGLQDEDIHVLYGSYPPSGGLGGISDAITGKFGERDLAGSLGPYLTVTPSLVPTFAALVKRESPPTGAEPLQGGALNAVCVHLLRALAGEKPLVWISEDLHFAPRESRDVVLSLARAVEGHRVLLLPTARPGVPTDELANFSRLENCQRLTVHRLGAREVIELLQDALRSEALAEKLGAKIALRSDGVPFFIFEMIRALKDGRFIRQEADGSYIQTQMIADIEVPSAVKDLIEGRLRDLDDQDREILDVGAVQGLAFSHDLTAKVLGMNRVQVLRRLAVVERRMGIVRDGGDCVRFDQNQIQEVVYQDLSPHLRSEYHALLAEAHSEHVEGEPAGEDAVFLASHHVRGSRPKEGLPHLAPALDFLGKSYRNDAVIDLASRALDVPRLLDGTERAKVLLKKAARHGLRGEREAERAALDEALALADAGEEPALRAKARLALSWHLIEISDYAAAQKWLREALGLARDADDKESEARATGILGVVLERLSRYEEARVQYERSLALAREVGDEKNEANTTLNLGTASWRLSRYEEARAHFERSLVLARRVGDKEVEAMAIGNLGIVLGSVGRYEEARAQFEECLVLAREIGDRPGEARATGNLGVVSARLGRNEQARAHYEKLLALAREVGDRKSEALGAGNLGSAFLDQGCCEEARAHFQMHLALAHKIGDRVSEARATGNLGLVYQRQGRHAQSRAQYEEYLALSREIGDQSQEGAALAFLASLADDEGDADEARRVHGEALVLRRRLGEKNAVAGTLVDLGRIEGKQGIQESAITHLEEALTLAQETKTPGTILSATVERARLPGGNVKAALAALREHEGRVISDTRMECRFRLWELTKDQTHLTEAKRLLDFAIAHASEESRTSMIEHVPLHRDIMKAWEEHRG
jgi:serine/threonine protein kinase/tetratricopeptide (TPR) repeat protein